MEVNSEDIVKISSQIEKIDGWKLENFKMWESASGKKKATLRLEKVTEEEIEEEEDKDDEEKEEYNENWGYN